MALYATGGGEGRVSLGCVFVLVGWSRGRKKLRFPQKDDDSATAECPVDPPRFVSSFFFLHVYHNTTIRYILPETNTTHFARYTLTQ